MADPPPPPAPRGLSLYENLHDPNDPSPAATISSSPVLYSKDAAVSDPSAAPAKKPIDPAFRFQPTRRPQPARPKPKATFPKSIPKPTAASLSAPAPAAAVATDASSAPATATEPPASAAAKSTLADWAATEDDEWLYGTGEKRQRGGRKAKKKRLQQQQQQMETDWGDIYDPSRPTNVDEYLRSDEKVDEVREWKALLYRHRKGKAPDSDVSSDDDEGQDTRPNQFAPPPSYGAVPPPPQSPPTATSAPPPPPDDATGDDIYARRLAMSQAAPPPPPPPPTTSSATISAAPIRYTQPQPSNSPSPPPTDDSNPRTSRPGQAGFAHRLMSKYGWTHGSGLGASSSGIVNPLRVQVEKRRKKADADGGGWAEPGGKGKIIGGGKKRQDEQGLSEVIVLLDMLDNMPDLAAEVENGLGQEIGEECGEKYGRVERVYIDTVTHRVFIKFTDQISALKAVSELQGRIFNGNAITPKYYNTEAFDQGIYDK